VNHLLRAHAPITDSGWALIDGEAKQRLVPGLAARQLVDFVGPGGWDQSAVNLGRVTEIDAPGDGLRVSQRRVLPLVEVRAAFSVSRDELADLERGATDIDLKALTPRPGASPGRRTSPCSTGGPGRASPDCGRGRFPRCR
jgi:uncharacterized linocin/CFP29 family protein